MRCGKVEKHGDPGYYGYVTSIPIVHLFLTTAAFLKSESVITAFYMTLHQLASEALIFGIRAYIPTINPLYIKGIILCISDFVYHTLTLYHSVMSHANY